MRGLALAAALVLEATSLASPRRVLRVCADPNNYPLSSKRGGFENDLAELIAAELGARVDYTWRAQRRGFFRSTLSANTCDVVMGVPVGLDMVRTTAPYYRSAYTIITRGDRAVRSLDDPALAKLKIGVQLAGDDGASPPPLHALAVRGIVDNVVGYNVMGDYREDGPPAAVVHAVLAGEVDVGIAWGPLTGGTHAKLAVTALPDERLPMAFDIALGVRKRDAELAAELDRVLVKRRAQIAKLLARWHIPTVKR
jgi:mxaJ protein